VRAVMRPPMTGRPDFRQEDVDRRHERVEARRRSCGRRRTSVGEPSSRAAGAGTEADNDESRARVDRAVDEIVGSSAGRTVVAVCHGGAVDVALASVLGLERPLWFDPHHTLISRMMRTGIRSVHSVNECVHLHARRERR